MCSNLDFKARNRRASLGCLVVADVLWALRWEGEGQGVQDRQSSPETAQSAQAAVSLPLLTRFCLLGPDPNASEYQWSASYLYEREGKVQGQ